MPGIGGVSPGCRPRRVQSLCACTHWAAPLEAGQGSGTVRSQSASHFRTGNLSLTPAGGIQKRPDLLAAHEGWEGAMGTAPRGGRQGSGLGAGELGPSTGDSAGGPHIRADSEESILDTKTFWNYFISLLLSSFMKAQQN